MKPKDYRLQTVLKIREHARDEAGRVVANRIEQLDNAQTELSQRQNNLLACFELQDRKQSAMDRVLDDGAQIKNVAAHRAFLKDLRERESELRLSAEKQRAVVARAENELESARDDLSESVRDFKAIETHRSKWAVRLKTDALRHEQKTNDEVGAMLYNRDDE